VKLCTPPLQCLIGPVVDLPDSFRMEETLAARNGRYSDAGSDGTICRKLARFRAEALVMIETRPGDGTVAKFAVNVEPRTGESHGFWGGRLESPSIKIRLHYGRQPASPGLCLDTNGERAARQPCLP
jgi:hypothetical protein